MEKIESLWLSIDSRIRIAVLIMGVMVSTTMTGLFIVRFMLLMAGFEVLFPSLIYPLSIVVIQFPVVWIMMAFGAVNEEERTFPQWQLAVVALGPHRHHHTTPVKANQLTSDQVRLWQAI